MAAFHRDATAARYPSMTATPATLPTHLAALLREDHTRSLALFRALDRDHEGSVDRAELIIALKRLGIAPVDAAVLLDAIDIHRTGKVELSELVAVISC